MGPAESSPGKQPAPPWLCRNPQRTLGYTPNKHHKAHRKSPGASREKSSQEGSRPESSDKRHRRKLGSTVATQFSDGFTNREAGGPKARTPHSPPQGQVLRPQGRSKAVKDGQRSRLSNSGSAHGLLPYSFDFYNLTIQASGEHENTTTQMVPQTSWTKTFEQKSEAQEQSEDENVCLPGSGGRASGPSRAPQPHSHSHRGPNRTEAAESDGRRWREPDKRLGGAP
uniref:Uncharacterized protein n=1 Tax=Rangifer tarandus platyrhynchus TaxID=3082113 RepID=A0ACB0EHF7_RANTA|nr:unnamed protein product [Rangifer tarandus platyrhynchus]